MKLSIWYLLALICCLHQGRCLNFSTKENENITESRIEWIISKQHNLNEVVNNEDNIQMTEPSVEWNILKPNSTKSDETFALNVNTEDYNEVTDSEVYWDNSEPTNLKEIESLINFSEYKRVIEPSVEWNISKLNYTKINATFSANIEEYEIVTEPGVEWNESKLASTISNDILSTEEYEEVTMPDVECNISQSTITKEVNTSVYNDVEPIVKQNVSHLNDITKMITVASNFSEEKRVTQTVEWNNKSQLNDTNALLLNTTEIEFQDYDEISTQFTSDYYDEQGNKNSARIIGGTLATSGQYPFAVYVANVNMQRGCSGVILSNLYVLTAASCVYDATSVSTYVGTVSPGTGTPLIVQGSAIIHPNFYLNTLEHDVALIRLSTPLTFSGTVNRIRLAKKHDADDYYDLVGKTVRIFGFGPATSGGAAPDLRVARMNVLPLSQCYKAMKIAYIKPATTHNCLNTEGGTVGMCSIIDVGGPVVYQFKDDSDFVLVGILSYFQMCASSIPNLFTRIGPYVDSIQKYVPNFFTG